MSDLVKRLRDPAYGSDSSERNLMEQAAARIEALEHANAVLQAKYDQAKTDRDTAMVKHIQEYADLERQLAEEKALGDRLIVAGANALQGDPRHDKGLSDAWDMAYAAYRKARGM